MRKLNQVKEGFMSIREDLLQQMDLDQSFDMDHLNVTTNELESVVSNAATNLVLGE